MSTAIRFLETLGSSPALIRQSAHSYAQSVADLEIEEGERTALLRQDADLLGLHLRVRPTIFCMISTPDQSPARAPDDDGKPEPDDKPDDEPQEE